MKKIDNRLAVVVLFVLVLALYVATLQRTVNGSAHDYTLDTGEIQVALNTVGTVHYTGYPLYTMMSTLLTLVARAVGMGPAAAASLSSLVWSLLGLGIVVHILLQLSGRRYLPAAGAVALLAATETVWIHSVIAEVYSFSLLLAALVLYMAIAVAQRPSRDNWLLLMLAWGTATAHHRTLLLLFPVLLIGGPALASLLRRHPRWMVEGVLLFLLPFLAYVYLPLRAWQGAAWVYGQPGTWAGFWEQFTGSEVTGGLLRLPAVEEVGANARFLAEHVRRQLPWPFVAGGALGLLSFVRERPWWAAGLGGVLVVVSVFVFLFPRAVWAPAALMPVIVVLVAGVMLLAQRLTFGRVHDWVWAAVLLVASVWLVNANRPFVQALATDQTGVEMVASLERLQERVTGGEEAVVAIPWGTHYFAGAFAKRVEERLPGLLLVDHRADFRQLVADDRRLMTPTFTQNYWSPDWWEERLGSVQLNEVAEGFVEIGLAGGEALQSPPEAPFNTGVGIDLWAQVAAMDGEETLMLTLWWLADEPVVDDYHVAVHLVAHDPPRDGNDVLAQADAVHAIDGWYPTSRWQPGVVVRDIYVLPHMSPQARAIRVALYRQRADGVFENSEWLSAPLPASSP